MCIFRKNKFDSLKREEVVDTICALEREDDSIENEIKIYSNSIKSLMDEGQQQKDRLERVFLVKKIMNLNESRSRLINRGLFILYNIKMSNKLKDAIDDKILVKKVQKMDVMEYLKDPKGLALYLNDVLDTKIKTEDILTEADDVFMEVKKMYSDNNRIYGINDISEDKLMSLFELSDEDLNQVDDNKQEE